MGFWGQGIQLDSYFGDQWSTLTSEVIKKVYLRSLLAIFQFSALFRYFEKVKIHF